MIRLFKHYIPHAVVVLGLIDLILLLMAGEIAWQLRAVQIDITLDTFVARSSLLVSFALLVWLGMIAVGVYGPEAVRSFRFAAARLLIALSFAVIALSVLDFVFPGSILWRSILLYAMAIGFVALLANRLVIGRMVGMEAFRRRIVVLGAGERARRLARIAAEADSGFAIVANIALPDGSTRLLPAVDRADIGDLGQFVSEQGATEVVLAIEERRKALPLKDLLRIKTMGIDVNECSSFLERETGRVDLASVNPSWLIFSDGFSAGRRISSVAKRIFDVAASGVLLLITAPVILIFALWVKLDSPGPAFFRQTRVGLYGQTFEVIKLRSMRTDAEKDGAKWAAKDDPRVTRLGKFIRKVRIDELPQTWSVLKGDMSFVGPRPEVPHFVSELEQHMPFYAERHMVKPGITGWAQINYPYGASIEDARHKLEYDLYYAKNYTPFLDLLILLQTLRVILWPEGAR